MPPGVASHAASHQTPFPGISMRRGNGSQLPITERQRRARKLQLVLQCAGPGSVTGSQSTQCRREGRPHGGYKGLSSQYPLSRSGFDSQEYMDEVKNSVNAQYREEQKSRTNSPQWLPAANKEKNHTGEQPLILQSFLAPNKQEQVDGVLPAPTPASKRPISSAGGKYRDDPDYFCRGNSTHQYLTATELPGQSVRLVDLTLGRPTRTSLLRVRQRTKSAPGVRAVVEVKSHLHKQQYLAAKTEDRYKSIDVPQDLLPVTENHETVHQFLVGARYNRMYHHDAKCLNNLGLFVSRQDPLHCFKMNVPGHDSHHGHVANLQGSMSSLSLSCESLGSNDELVAGASDYPEKPAWSTGAVGDEDDNVMTSKGTTVRSVTPAPSPSPASRSRETFAPAERRRKPKVKLLDGKALASHNDDGNGCEDCVLCMSQQQPAKHHQRFAPGSHFAHHAREVRKDEEESDWHHNKDHMLVQQYHLRIMGIKYGMKSGPQAPPRNNLLYTTKRAPHSTDLPAVRQAKSLSGAGRSRGSGGKKTGPSTTTPPADKQAEGPSSGSSKISVIISTHGDEDGDDEVAAPQEDFPKSEAVLEAGDPSKDLGDESNGARGVTDEVLESGQEGLDETRRDDTAAGSHEAVDAPAAEEAPEDPGIGQVTGNDGDAGAKLGEECRVPSSDNETSRDSDEPPATADGLITGGGSEGKNGSQDTKVDNSTTVSCDDEGNDAADAADTRVDPTPAEEMQGDSVAEDSQDMTECPVDDMSRKPPADTSIPEPPDREVSDEATENPVEINDTA